MSRPTAGGANHGLANLSSSGSSSSGSPYVTSVPHSNLDYLQSNSSPQLQHQTTSELDHSQAGSTNASFNSQASQFARSVQKESDLQNLLRLLEDIKYYQASSSPLPTTINSQKQKEFIDKIHKTLPLFINLFGTPISQSCNQHQQHANQSTTITRPHGSTSYNTSTSRFGRLTSDLTSHTSSSLDRDMDSHSICSADSNLSLATKTPTSPCPPRETSLSLERYPIIKSFCYTIARLFVSELRQRATKGDGDEAVLSILEYLSADIKKLFKSDAEMPIEQQPSQEVIEEHASNQESVSHGWNMLHSVQIIVTNSDQNSEFIKSLCKACVPSTLMKCLSLLFEMQSLSDLRRKQLDRLARENILLSSTSNPTRVLPPFVEIDMSIQNNIMSPLIQSFTQTLVNLCNSPVAIEELVKKDDLKILFYLASTQCRPFNRPWRNVAFQSLSSISKCMRDNFDYLNTHNCVLNYVENLHKHSTMGTINFAELVEMIKCLSEFVYNLETNNRNQIASLTPIVEQMVAARFIDFVEELLIRLDDLIEVAKNDNKTSITIQHHQEPRAASSNIINGNLSISSSNSMSIQDYRRLARHLVRIMPIISKINTTPSSMSELLTLKPCATSRYNIEFFKMPKPSALHCVLNLDAIRLFKTAWSRCRDIHLIECLLDATITLFHHDKYNYFIFESQQLLVYYLTSENFATFPVRIKHKLFKFIEFITLETNYFPCLELATLGSILKQQETHCTNTYLILIMRTLIACLRINPKFSDIFREIGLLEIIIEIFTNSVRRQKKYLEKLATNQHQGHQALESQSERPTLRLEQRQPPAVPLEDSKFADANNLEVLHLSLEVIQCLLFGPNGVNCTQFNESGAARLVFSCLSKPQQFYPIIQRDKQQGQLKHPHNSSSEDNADLSMCSSPGGAYPIMAPRAGQPQAAEGQARMRATSIAAGLDNTNLNSANNMANANYNSSKFPTAKQIQKVSFSIIRQLINSGAGDEHLANLLGLLARSLDDLRASCEAGLEISRSALTETSSPNPAIKVDFESMVSQEISLKICILKSLMIVLKENHRCRALFRKTGGFVCVISALESIRNILPNPGDQSSIAVSASHMDKLDLEHQPKADVEVHEASADGSDGDRNGDRDDDVVVDLALDDCTTQEISRALRNLNSRRIWRLIKSCLMTVVIAMRCEQANIRAFVDDAQARFTKAIRHLGCFVASNTQLKLATTVMGAHNMHKSRRDEYNSAMAHYKAIFLAAPTRDYSTISMEASSQTPSGGIKSGGGGGQSSSSITADSACCQLFRFLYDMSLDMGDGTGDLDLELEHMQDYVYFCKQPTTATPPGDTGAPVTHHGPAAGLGGTRRMSYDRSATDYQVHESEIFRRRCERRLNAAPKRPPSLDLNASRHSTRANLTFPSLILSIMDLLPSCPSDELALFVSLVIKSLFRHERNRQLLCECGLISKMLDSKLRVALTSERHFLHEIFEFLFEKLSKQMISTRELSTFLRADQPMLCANLDEIDSTTLGGDHQSPRAQRQASESPQAGVVSAASAATNGSSDESNYLSASPGSARKSPTCQGQTANINTSDNLGSLCEEPSDGGEKISRHKIESLVAMMTPTGNLAAATSSTSTSCATKPMRASGSSALTTGAGARSLADCNNTDQPPFVEFDVSLEGGSSLIFMPSIAPINVKLLGPHSSAFLSQTLDVHTSEKNGLLGGVGTKERQFPPTNGLTFSSWICISHFPTRSSDSNHNLRLLTIYRGSASTGKEYTCLRIEISALDRSLIVSTQESLLFEPDFSNMIAQSSSSIASRNHQQNYQPPPVSQQTAAERNFRVWTPELLLENRWHHLAISLHRTSSQSKHPNVIVYVDGVAAHSDRLSYISHLVGPPNLGPLGQMNASNTPSAPAYVNAFVGSLPQFRQQAQVSWKQGPMHLIEEPLSSSFVAVIYALGPKFIGNFQSSIKLNELARARLLQLAQSDLKFFKQLDSSSRKHHHSAASQSTTAQDNKKLSRVASTSGGPNRVSSSANSSPLHRLHSSSSPSSAGAKQSLESIINNQYSLPEEKLLISIQARASSMMSLARMRKIYMRFDCRQIMRVLQLSSNDNSIPILVLHNTCLHLTGSSRGVGAVTIGLNSVRCFVPHPVHSTLTTLGGCHILLAFIAQADTMQSFELSMLALVNGLKQNSILQAQMDSISGYQILEMFLWRKKHLLSEQILSLIFSLITDTTKTRHFDQEPRTLIIQQVNAVRDLICECFDLWAQTNHIELVLEFIYDLINSSNHVSLVAQSISEVIQCTRQSSIAGDLVATPPSATSSSQQQYHQRASGGQSSQLAALMSSARNRNLKCLRELDLLPAILRLLPYYNNSQQQQQQQPEFNIPNVRDDNENSNQQQHGVVINSGKAIYLIRQIVFELLNKTPRQSDLLYFGQFLASLLPLDASEERASHIVNLRNILLKSLLQMMTKNKQVEINRAMQEEMVRILGFDWFMLFFSHSNLSQETITIGFLNFMVVLSNDELYGLFRLGGKPAGKQAGSQQQGPSGAAQTPLKGGWLKEPYFGSIDGKFNIQLLGMNVGFFFGTGTKRKSIRQSVIEAPNLFLLTSCLKHLVTFPNIHLMLLMLIMNKFSNASEIDPMTLDTIGTFDVLSFDSLCDCLVGETHTQRRATLAACKLKCCELVVCLIYMLREIMRNSKSNSNEDGHVTRKSEQSNSSTQFPNHIIKFLMYLYNNNTDFQFYCRRSEELMLALAECFMTSQDNSEMSGKSLFDQHQLQSLNDWTQRATATATSPESIEAVPKMAKSKHSATAELLDFCKLIILDSMTEISRWLASPTSSSQATSDQQQQQQQQPQHQQQSASFVQRVANNPADLDPLHALETFVQHLQACPEVRDELLDLLMTHILLMIDSAARNNSLQTMSNSQGMVQFQMLLVNSILVAQFATDRIWANQLFVEDLNLCARMIEHQLCLTEQVFKFNELLPIKQAYQQSHPQQHAFIMQRTINRMILFALSPARNVARGSEKMLQLELLKRIYNNRNIIIFNHMRSEHSAQFFVCLTYCLMHIMDMNAVSTPTQQQPAGSPHHQSCASSLIERKFGHQSSVLGEQATSTALMIYSMARKVWDSVFQGQKGLLSEALDVSLTLPAFTLDTSIDLMQLRPDIEYNCGRHWNAYIDMELKQRQSQLIQQRQETEQGQHSSPRQQSRQKRLARNINNANEQTTTPTASSQLGGAASSAVNMLSGRLTKVVNAASFVSRVVGATAGNMASNVNLVGERFASSGASSAAGFARAGRSSNGGGGGASGDAFSSDGSSTMSALALICATKGLFSHESLTQQDVEGAFQTHTIIIEDYIKSHLGQKNHKLALHKYVRDDWLQMEHEILLRERAIFGPTKASKLDKWALDMTEGPKRMRKKMFNNTRFFYENYPYKAELHNPDNKSLRYRPPMSFHCQEHHFKTLKLNQNFLTVTSSPETSQSNLEGDEQASLDQKQSSEHEQSKQSSDYQEASGEMQHEQQAALKINVDSPSPGHDQNFSIDDLGLMSNNDIGSAKSNKQPFMGCGGAKSSSVAGSDIAASNANNNNADDDSTSFGDFDPEIEAEVNNARDSENIDSLSVLRLLEKNERISHMFRCSRVQGLDTHEGLMLFGREHLYLIDGFTLLKTREIKDIDSLPLDAHDPIIPNSTPNLQAQSSRKVCAKFPYDGIVEVHKRRYLLQPIALEVFSGDGRNSLIVFPRNIRNKVHGRLMSVSTQLTSNAHESLAGQKSNVSVEGGGGLFSSLIGDTSVTQRWVRGELSNFQYLMNLNTIAGRSYNDLMQYPIFPWILADYSSDYLDLTKPSSFRDLSRPIGAQTAERLEQFKRRYADWDDNETPPYHYGTFYSSAMIVASYMVRMEPFTQHFLRLQGGHFDLADRMFHSISDSWLSASKHNMADIKELIPEFFYLPEFLCNENRYDLGLKQSGQRLDNVVLPPWAKNDAREFIRLHRSALESEYVSAHLHEWIDLIFGHKQQGQAAIDAVNVFHHLFYEGNVDIYNTDIDPIKKNAVIGFINNFGQVPKQLFKKPHPARRVLHSYNSYGTSSGSSSALGGGTQSPILPSLTSAVSTATSTNSRDSQSSVAGGQQHPGAQNLTHCPHLLRRSPSGPSNLKDLRGPVGQIVNVEKTTIAVEQNKLLIPPEYCRYVAWGHADRSVRLGLYDSEKSIFVWEGSDGMAPSDILCCTIPNQRTLVTAGMDCMITIWKIERMKSFSPLLSLYGHTEPVTCLASSQAYSLIVSGSRDRTAIIWDLNKFTFLRQLGGGKIIHPAPISAIAINESTGDIATCASNWLFLWTINGELLAEVDALQATNRFYQVQAIPTNQQQAQQHCFFPNALAGSLGGVGSRQATANPTQGQLHILSVCFSTFREWSLDEVIVTGGSDGSVAIWSMRYTQKPTQDANRPTTPGGRKSSLSTVAQSPSAKPRSKLERFKVGAAPQSTGSVDSIDEVLVTNNSNNMFESTFESSSSSNQTQPKQHQQPTTAEGRAEMMAVAKERAMLNRRERQRSDTLSSDWVRLSNSSGGANDVTNNKASDDSMGQQEQQQQKQDPETLARILESVKLATAEHLPISSTPFKQQHQKQQQQPSNQAAIAGDDGGGANKQEQQTTNGAETSKLNLLLNASDPSFLKFSKSDSSIVDSFVIVGGDATTGSPAAQSPHVQYNQPSSLSNQQSPRPKSSVGGFSVSSSSNLAGPRDVGGVGRQHPTAALRSTSVSSGGGGERDLGHLSPGHEWRRELYLRTILAKSDKMTYGAPSAAVTSLTISKNHRTIFVGDASGKVSSWSL